ncbi:MAG: urease accessory protein UreD [Deltaproteobacteria bacterium]|nr:urease accessory protein UreD [Deltaproteobacteria bacterium]
MAATSDAAAGADPGRAWHTAGAPAPPETRACSAGSRGHAGSAAEAAPGQRPLPGGGPGWNGLLALSFAESGGRTVLDRTERSGPLGVQRPFYPEGPAPDGIVPCEVYVLHPPGGLVTGDALEISAACGPGAKALLTSPAATKFYRAKETPGFQRQSFLGKSAGPGAVLEHLPQEAIAFSGTRAVQDTTLVAADGGRLMAWGITLLGRAAAGEAFERGSYAETLRVYRDGDLALFERAVIEGEAEPGARGLLASPLGLMGRPVMSWFLALGAGSASCEAGLAAALGEFRILTAAGEDGGFPEFRGATLRDGILLARSVGGDVSRAERYNRLAWSLARRALLGREAVHPRIWRT